MGQLTRKQIKEIIKQSKEVIKDSDRAIAGLTKAISQARVNKATAEAIIKGL